MKRILIIDDEKDLARMVQTRLNYYGYDSFILVDPRKALEVAEKKKPDLILLDVLMPQVNGREVCKQLKGKETTKDIPVIFLTAKDSGDDIAAEMEVGGSGHVLKPINDKELLEVVSDLIG